MAETGLILVDDDDAKSIGATILDEFKDAMWRGAQISLNGSGSSQRVAILGRDIGDVIRFKRRQGGGTAIDVVTTVIGQSKTVDVDRNLWCTWNLARGFNAADGTWRLGLAGFTELNSTAVLV